MPDDRPDNRLPDDRPTVDRPAGPDADPDEKPQVSTYDVIGEALRLQAERRKASGPPREMPVTPTLPRQPRPARDRKKRRR